MVSLIWGRVVIDLHIYDVGTGRASRGCQEDVKIPADLVGLFIGKGGETIKDLRDRPDAHVSRRNMQ